MKVIIPGRTQEGWSKEFTCTGSGNGGGGCTAKLLVEQADLFKTFSHHRDETDTFVTFACCQCGVKTDLPPGGVPPNFDLPSEAEWLELRDKEKEATNFEKSKNEVKRLTRDIKK